MGKNKHTVPVPVHTVGVTGSIPVAPTTLFKGLAEKRGGFDPEKHYSCNVPLFVRIFYSCR